VRVQQELSQRKAQEIVALRIRIMQTLEVEVLDHISNNPMVRLPTRKYPGVLIRV